MGTDVKRDVSEKDTATKGKSYYGESALSGAFGVTGHSDPRTTKKPANGQDLKVGVSPY
jgi:hypothetical protein